MFKKLVGYMWALSLTLSVCVGPVFSFWQAKACTEILEANPNFCEKNTTRYTCGHAGA
jgi:hypothetical protein